MRKSLLWRGVGDYGAESGDTGRASFKTIFGSRNTPSNSNATVVLACTVCAQPVFAADAC